MILRRVMAMFTSMTFIAFTILGGLLYSLVGNYAVSEKKDTLISAAEELTEISEHMAQEDFESYLQLLDLSFGMLSRNLNCEILMADKNGKVLFRTFLKYPEDKIENIPGVLVSAVMNGNIADMTGDLKGISKRALAIGVPLDFNEKVIAGIYMITNLPDLTQIRNDVLFMYALSFLVALAISFVLAYFLSEKITEPIKAIKKAADDFSRGQLDTRIKINSKNELHFLAESFNHMADSLSEVEKQRASFVSDISHELRTPMTTITGFVQGILDDTIPPDKQHLYLKIVLDETKRLSKLVSDLLENSRYNSESLKLEKTSFDINEQLRITIIGFEKRFMEKRLVLNADFKNDNEFVYADKDSIKRVLTNLIDNAVKFSYEGGRIDITTSSEGDKVTISIRNEGEGIPKEVQNFIFERFYKFDKSRSQNKNGVGLGLSMVKSIINKHGEKIELNSEPGKYAEFTFKLKKYKN